jgi:hypothetical protein
MRTRLVLSCLSIFFCSVALAASPNTKTSFVKVSRTPCFGVCPVYSVTVYEDGTFVYKGISNVNKQGELKGAVSKHAVANLFTQIDRLHFFWLKSRYGIDTDLAGVVIQVLHKGRRKTVTDFEGKEEISQLAELVENITGISQFVTKEPRSTGPVEYIKRLHLEDSPATDPLRGATLPALAYSPAGATLEKRR